MNRVRFRPNSWLSSVALYLLVSSPAFAACTVQPGLLPFHIRVGADTTHCQANDIQSAINAVGECSTVIDITREHTYTNQHLSIDNKANVTLQGWGDVVTCAQIPQTVGFPAYTPPSDIGPLLDLDGSNDGNGRVLTITGSSNVSIRNLTIENGSAADSASGGGINFDGQGSLELTRSTVSFNHAGFGAGVNVNGSSGPTTLTLDPNTLIILNTASTSGGGIRMQGNSRLYALKPNTLIGYNHAPNGYGGGLEVLGPARADIGSSGYGGLGVIYDNDASYGGGIDVLTFDDDANAIVRVFTTDSNNPVQISGNFASHTGGAVYLKPLHGIASEADSALCAYDFRIEDNAAPEGAAIYSDADYSPGIVNTSDGGSIALNTSAEFRHGNLCVQTELPSALGAVACAAGVPCNQFVGNKTEDQNGQATEGSMILLQNSSEMYGDRFSARANTGAHLLREVGDGAEGDTSEAQLSNCLLADNMLTQELAAQTDGTESYLLLDSCTIANNQIGAPYVMLGSDTALRNSIIDQPGRATINPAITDPFYAAYVLTNDRSTLPDTVYIHEGEPTFVDAANGNYHLMPTSLGVDSAPLDSLMALHVDLDLKPRVVDLQSIPDNFGPMDLGAYELQSAFACGAGDTIFCNGFEP
jgi:hypothetical protein